jgi:hypothetical protein
MQSEGNIRYDNGKRLVAVIIGGLSLMLFIVAFISWDGDKSDTGLLAIWVIFLIIFVVCVLVLLKIWMDRRITETLERIEERNKSVEIINALATQETTDNVKPLEIETNINVVTEPEINNNDMHIDVASEDLIEQNIENSNV